MVKHEPLNSHKRVTDFGIPQVSSTTSQCMSCICIALCHGHKQRLQSQGTLVSGNSTTQQTEYEHDTYVQLLLFKMFDKDDSGIGWAVEKSLCKVNEIQLHAWKCATVFI